MIEEKECREYISKYILRIMDMAEGEGREALQASKFLVNYFTQLNKKVGRPSNEAIKKEAQRIISEAQDIKEDYKRIVLTK